MTSLYVRGTKLWVRVKNADGTWKSIATGFNVGEEKQAEAALKAAQETLATEARYGVPAGGPLTVALFQTRWLELRKRTVKSWENDESRLRLYVLPVIGKMPLADVRPRHLADLFRDLRTRSENKLAPKTVLNTYATVRALFRDANIEGLITQTPCILTEHQLGKSRDADPEWRSGAQFTRGEAESLISDSRIPFDRRVLWGLMVAAGLRHGEAAGLRWRHVDRETKPLGTILVCTSYDTGSTKTGDTRSVPIHPTLAALLAEWRGHGWAEELGRQPGPDDLVAPTPKTSRSDAGAMRVVTRTLKLLHRDLATLGFRERRVHDLRRTFISLARTDGAEKSILKRATHKAPRDVMEGYTTFEFEVLCREVLKLNLKLKGRGELITLARAAGDVVPGGSAGGDQGFATVFATVEAQTQRSPGNLSASGASFLRGVGDLNP